MIQGCNRRVLAFLLAGLWLGAGCASWRVVPDPAPDLAAVMERAESLPNPAERNAMLVQALHAKVQDFQCLVLRNQELRDRILAEANRLESLFDSGRGIDARDLQLVSEGAARYVRLRQELLRLVDRYQCLLPISEAEFEAKGVDPRVRLVAVMVSVGAALTLYDNYFTTVLRFERSPALRRYINEGDSGAGLDRRQLEEMGRSARSLVNRGQVRLALQGHERWEKSAPVWKARFHPGPDVPDLLEQDYQYLEALVHSSISYAFLAGVRPAAVGGLKIDALGQSVGDLMHQGSRTALEALARVFVEASAVLNPRRGRLTATPEATATNLAALQPLLRPGDILLDKAPFRLNDRLVPGYWGHVGLWLGTENELASLGFWESAGYRQLTEQLRTDFRAQVREGRSLIEAARGGVQMTTLEDFMDVDCLVVLRPRPGGVMGSPSQVREVLLNALAQHGRRYDFSFDVHTPARLVCSELIYRAYTQPELDWPRSKVLGRHTVTPDQVAQRALEGTAGPPPLEVVVLYRDGTRVEAGGTALAAELGRLIKWVPGGTGPAVGPGAAGAR